jgi:hypothetical protein
MGLLRVQGRRSLSGWFLVCGEGNGETTWRREWLLRFVLKERGLWVCCCLCRGDAGEPKMAGAMGEK